jgi:hypothetical protein
MWLCGGSSLQPDGTLSIWNQAGKRTPSETLQSTDQQRLAQCPWCGNVFVAPISILKTDHLPRQALDKHGKS